MTITVPLIRTMSLLPAVRWVAANGHSVEALLRSADLSGAHLSDPLRPIPLLNVGRLLKSIARLDGADVACRIVSSASPVELALLGRVALGTTTPEEALTRIAAALPLFCSHEQLYVQKQADSVVIRHGYLVDFEPETEHLMLQYALAMADRILGMTGASPPRIRRIELPPHPDYGLNHLATWFDQEIVAGKDRGMRLEVAARVFGRPFKKIARDRFASLPLSDIKPLRGDGRLASSARTVVAAMLQDGVPTVEQLANVAGVSVRTLQRRLKAEETSFAEILDAVRRDAALDRLNEDDTLVVSVSADVGYRRQASLTRAVRRWTGQTPTHLKHRKSSD